MSTKKPTTWKDAVLAIIVFVIIVSFLGKCADSAEENSELKQNYEQLKGEYEDYREEMKRELVYEYERGYDHGYYDAEHGLSYDEDRSQ